KDLVDDLVDGRNWRGKAEVCHWGEHFSAICDSFGLCKFPNNENLVFLPEDYVEPFEALTGLGMDLDAILQSAERIVNLERALNVREFGLTRKDDMLPKRFLTEKLVVPGVDDEGSVIELPKMLDRYYELRGWDPATGRPMRKTLERLDLKDVADALGNAIS
ncbi:MAG: aldehyde ferredoxin oxidoreductase C-terminal domain-containing protein, partial [Candidatus Ranarchaeia archaeon]